MGSLTGVRVPQVFSLDVQVPGTAPRMVLVDRSPYAVGRSRENQLRLELPGIWDRHLIFEIGLGDGLLGSVHPGALARLRGGEELGVRHRLRNGDEIEVGGVLLRVGLIPASRRSLTVWEWVLWLIFAAVALGQSAFFYHLITA